MGLLKWLRWRRSIEERVTRLEEAQSGIKTALPWGPPETFAESEPFVEPDDDDDVKVEVDIVASTGSKLWLYDDPIPDPEPPQARPTTTANVKPRRCHDCGNLEPAGDGVAFGLCGLTSDPVGPNNRCEDWVSAAAIATEAPPSND